MILPTFTVMESEETPKTCNDNVQKSDTTFENLLDNNIDSDGNTLDQEMIDIADEDIDEEDAFSDESLRLKLSDDENEPEDTVVATESNSQFPAIKQETSFENGHVSQEQPKSNAICKKADQSLGKKNDDDAERKENVWCDGNNQNSSSDKFTDKSTDGQSAFSGTFRISRAPTWARDGVITANGVCPQLNSSTKGCSNNHAEHGKRKRLRNGYTYSLNRHVRVQYFRGKSKSSTGCNDNGTKDGDEDNKESPQSSVERDINLETESGINETNGNKDCAAKFPSASKTDAVDDSGKQKNDLNVEPGCSNVVADDNSVTAPIQNHDDSTDQSARLTSKMNNSGDSIPLPNELGKECIHLNLDAECDTSVKEESNTDDTANTRNDHKYDPSIPNNFTATVPSGLSNEDNSQLANLYEARNNRFSEDCELESNEERSNLDGEANPAGSLNNDDHDAFSNDVNSHHTTLFAKTTTSSPMTSLYPESVTPTLVDLELVREESTENNPVAEQSIDKPFVESLEAAKKLEPVKENMVSGDKTILEVQSSEVQILEGKTSPQVGTVLPEVTTNNITSKRKKKNKKKRKKGRDAPFNFDHLTSVLKLNKLGNDAASLHPMNNGSTQEMKIVRASSVEQVNGQKTITADKDPSGMANANEACSTTKALDCHKETGNSVGQMIIDEQSQTKNEATANMNKDLDTNAAMRQESEDNALLASKTTNKRSASVALAEEVSQESKVTDEMHLSNEKKIVKSTDKCSEVATRASTITNRRGSGSKRNFAALEIPDETTNHKKIRRTSLPTKLSDPPENENGARTKQIEYSNRTLNYVRKFFQRDGSGKLIKLKPEEMEELLIQKIVETITMRSEIGKLREQARISERNQEATRLRCQQLAKQIKDFELVLTRNAVERRNNNDKPVPPIKINRSVGLQVNFTTEYGLQNLRTLTSCQPLKPIPPPPLTPVVTGPSNVPVHNGCATPTPEKIVQPRTSVSPRGSIKIRSPRRPEVPTSLPAMVQSQVTTITTTVASKPSEPTKQTPAIVNNVHTSTIVIPAQVPQAPPPLPPLPPLVPTAAAAKLQNAVLNGKLTLHTNPPKTIATTQKTTQNEMIDLTEEEDKNKAAKSNPPSLVSIVTTAAPTALAPKPIPARLQRIFSTLPANIQPRNIRVVQNAAQPTPTALVNNINATTLAYVMQANPGVGRQLLIAPHGNQLRPVLSPRPQYSTVTYKPAITIPNGTVRTQMTTTNAASTLQHPAPLPETPYYPKKAGLKSPPPPPSLKISKVKQGIILSWNMALSDSYAEIASYQLYAYQEIPGTPPSTSLWKKVGDVRALPLPMACTLKEFTPGNKYHFAVRAVDSHTRLGQYSTPGNIAL